MSKNFDIKINTKADQSGAKQTGQSLEQLGKKTKKLTTDSGKGTKKIGDGFNKLTKSIRSNTKAVTAWGLKFAAAVTGATIAVGALAVNSAKFNITIARAQTMADKLGFKRLRQEALEMSDTLGVVKTEIASGLYNALSAGIPEDNLFAFVNTAAKIAVADGSSIEVAVDGMTTILNSAQLDISEFIDVADKMFQTVAGGKTNFGDLASYIAQAAPTAAGLNVPFKEMLGAVSAMTKQGEPTASAFNKIRNSMLLLNKELGEGWSEAYSLQDALEAVAKKYNYSSSALTKIFGMENVSGVMMMVGKNYRAAKTALDDLENSAGALEKRFKMVDQFKHWDKAFETVKSIMLQIGNVIDDTIKPDVEAITAKIHSWVKNTKFWDDLAENFKEIRDDITGLIRALQAGQGPSIWRGVKDVLLGVLEEGGAILGGAILKAMPYAASILKEALSVDWLGTKAREKRSYTETLVNDFGYSEEDADSMYYQDKGDQAANIFKGTRRMDNGLKALGNIADRYKPEPEPASTPMETEPTEQSPTKSPVDQETDRAKKRAAIERRNQRILELEGSMDTGADFDKKEAMLKELYFLKYRSNPAEKEKLQGEYKTARDKLNESRIERDANMTPQERMHGILGSVENASEYNGQTYTDPNVTRITQREARKAIVDAANRTMRSDNDAEIIDELIAALNKMGAVVKGGFSQLRTEIDKLDGEMETTKSVIKKGRT